MDEILLVVLFVLSTTIVAWSFAYSFALGSWIKPIIYKLRQTERFEERSTTLKHSIDKEMDAERFEERSTTLKHSIDKEIDVERFEERSIPLTLLIDKEMDKVLFAESNKDFVEVLFSFLTLPMGEIVRLCKKNTGIPPLENLYASVEALDEQFFQTAASKNMLLRPRSAYRYSSELAIDLDQKDPSSYYICSQTGCSDRHGFRLVSLVKGSECICKEAMRKQICVNAMIADNTGGFLKDRGKFIISDDLDVRPVTATNTQKLIKRETKSPRHTEVREVTIRTKEVLQILKYSMISTRPLTNALLRDNDALGASSVPNRASGPYSASTRPLLRVSECTWKTLRRRQEFVPIEKIKGNLLMKKSTEKIIALEAREDLADLMFSFLTIPLGSVVKLCGKQGSSLGRISNLYRSNLYDEQGSSLGCISNLYGSLEQLDVDNFKSISCKNHLLSPKIAPKYGCKSQLLKIEEEKGFDPSYRYMYICYECFLEKKHCSHGASEKIAIINPKIPGQITGGGRFLKKKGTLIFTNDLRVEYLQPALHVSQGDPLDVLINGIDLDEEKVLKILHYLMTSANVLDNALPEVVRKDAYSLEN